MPWGLVRSGPGSDLATAKKARSCVTVAVYCYCNQSFIPLSVREVLQSLHVGWPCQTRCRRPLRWDGPTLRYAASHPHPLWGPDLRTCECVHTVSGSGGVTSSRVKVCCRVQVSPLPACADAFSLWLWCTPVTASPLVSIHFCCTRLRRSGAYTRCALPATAGSRAASRGARRLLGPHQRHCQGWQRQVKHPEPSKEASRAVLCEPSVREYVQLRQLSQTTSAVPFQTSQPQSQRTHCWALETQYAWRHICCRAAPMAGHRLPCTGAQTEAQHASHQLHPRCKNGSQAGRPPTKARHSAASKAPFRNGE